ncbi:MAG: methyltransferase domain-containing protein [Chthoniobacteraceae bacterium]
MPTNWETHYQEKDTPWDKGAPSPGLEDFLASESLGGRVLVPGCGAGHDVRAFAAAGLEVVGIDIAPSAIVLAQTAPSMAKETYECADLFALPPHLRGRFDWVWEHTCFCAIDPAQRPAYVQGVHAALKPGGHLLAIFYLDPGNDSPDEGPPFEVSLADLDTLFQPRFSLVREWLPERTYPGREGREWMRVLRRLD